MTNQCLTMKVIKGDLLKLAQAGQFDVIVHGYNCFCTMGAGIARGIKTVFPEAYAADLRTIKGDRAKLGSFSHAEIELSGQKLIVVNAYTQFTWRGRGRKVDYDAVRSVFQNIKTTFSGLRIGYPAIGAGLAGGGWQIIAAIIDESLAGEDHTFVEFAG